MLALAVAFYLGGCFVFFWAVPVILREKVRLAHATLAAMLWPFFLYHWIK